MDTFKKTESEIHPALTSLSDEEQMFREAVRDFSTSEIAPIVSQMDQTRELDAGWITPCVMYGNESSSAAPSSDFQGVQFQLADAATELEASRLLVYNAARLKDAGEDFLVPSAMAKLHSSRMAQKVTSLCIDLYGGYGFTKEYPVGNFIAILRSARSTRARPICNSKPSPRCF